MYRPGYFPQERTAFRGLKVYRNMASGIFIHRCHNLTIDQGLFADNNNIGIDLDRAEGIEVTNTTVIGLSPLYGSLMTNQVGVAPVCDRNERVGIDLHTWQKEIDFIGAKISNVAMSGFTRDDPNNKCTTPSSLRFDKFVSETYNVEIYMQRLWIKNIYSYAVQTPIFLTTDTKARTL
jgi:hypothetical protein